MKYKNPFKPGARKFHFPKYTKFFGVGFFYFSSLESSLMKYKNPFKPGTRKFHFPKYNENVFGKIKETVSEWIFLIF